MRSFRTSKQRPVVNDICTKTAHYHLDMPCLATNPIEEERGLEKELHIDFSVRKCQNYCCCFLKCIDLLCALHYIRRMKCIDEQSDLNAEMNIVSM